MSHTLPGIPVLPMFQTAAELHEADPSLTIWLPGPGNRRIIGVGRMVCGVCAMDVVASRERKIPRSRMVVGVHGPRENRCRGSKKPGVPWLAAHRLPGWAGMSDHDRGAALTFVASTPMPERPAYEGVLLADLPDDIAGQHVAAAVDQIGERRPRERLIVMARRVLGDREVDRLMVAGR